MSPGRDKRVAASAEELRRLNTEIVRLHEENDDLRASALWWFRLYEGVLNQTHEPQAERQNATNGASVRSGAGAVSRRGP